MTYPVISADSHSTEPANPYVDPIDRVSRSISMGLVADAVGVRAVLVEGTIVCEDGRDAVDLRGALPSRVLRGS